MAQIIKAMTASLRGNQDVKEIHYDTGGSWRATW